MIYSMQHIEEAIQNYSPTVMFRGTPCSILIFSRYQLNITKFSRQYYQRLWELIYYPCLVDISYILQYLVDTTSSCSGSQYTYFQQILAIYYHVQQILRLGVSGSQYTYFQQILAIYYLVLQILLLAVLGVCLFLVDIS